MKVSHGAIKAQAQHLTYFAKWQKSVNGIYLQEVWSQPSGQELCDLCNELHSNERVDTVQEEMYAGCHCIGDV